MMDYTARRPFNYAIGWIKLPDREHWLVRNGSQIVGELFQVQKGHQYYALVYDRVYKSPSGCLESTALHELEDFFNGLSFGEV